MTEQKKEEYRKLVLDGLNNFFDYVHKLEMTLEWERKNNVEQREKLVKFHQKQLELKHDTIYKLHQEIKGLKNKYFGHV